MKKKIINHILRSQYYLIRNKKKNDIIGKTLF